MYNTSDEIKRRLWAGANDLRGSMDASKYKDYMLGLMFYKFLSDETLNTFKEQMNIDDSKDIFDEYEEAFNKYGEERVATFIQSSLGYYVKPEYLYQKWVRDINSGDFELQTVMDSLNSFERTIAVSSDSDDFKGLFSNSIIDLTDSALGSDLKKRHKNIRDLILLFADLNMVDLKRSDVLGDAYEYLIGQFASNAGKKAGEFYTPRQVSEVMARIVAKTKTITSIYDPTVGSGSLLLTVGKHLSKSDQRKVHYYGQEYITETYNLTRMNLLLHGVRPEQMDIRNGNTLAQDWPEDPNRPGEGVQFDAVVMNPPYSDKKWNKHEDIPLKINDPRFSDFGVLPPDSKGDFAYLMHGLYHLGQQGTMAIVLPHGVLFRGETEGIIRRKLVEKNHIDAIIGLPSNMFTNTGIPVVILILKKNRALNDPVLIIDASNEFEKIGKHNVLRERDIEKIVDTYINKKEIKNYSHLANLKEIKANDYNLNIPRYVNIEQKELIQDVDGHLLGGIPKKSIENLKVIQDSVPKIIKEAFKEVRPGYVQLVEDISLLKKDILDSDEVKSKTDDLLCNITKYFERSYNQLKNIDSSNALKDIKENMLDDIKKILKEYDDVDEYAGYQIMAELWNEYLENDLEVISNDGFYAAGRTRRPNIVTKGQGQKKHEEQDGWVGAIIPNDLMKTELFKNELNQIEIEKNKIGDFQVQLDEIRDTLSEDEGEFGVLNDDNTAFNLTEVNAGLKDEFANITIPEVKELNEYLEFLDSKPKKIAKLEYMEEHQTINWDKIDKNRDGTVGKGNTKKRIKDLESSYEFSKGTFGAKLAKVSRILEEKKQLEKEIKEQEKQINETVYSRIEHLTDKEIDELVYKKWFGTLSNKFVALITTPIINEIAILDKLNKMYSVTMNDLDEEIATIESEFNKLLNELVVK